MSKLIVGIPLLVIFVMMFMQGIIDDINENHKSRFNDILHKYTQQARTTGYFTPDQISSMRRELAQAFYVQENEVVINCTTTPKYRLDAFDVREMISYEVTIPQKKMFAAPLLLGISEADNSALYVKRGEVASELLMP